MLLGSQELLSLCQLGTCDLLKQDIDVSLHHTQGSYTAKHCDNTPCMSNGFSQHCIYSANVYQFYLSCKQQPLHHQT